jgi:hypothetical protein
MLDDLFAPDALIAARDVVMRPPPVPKQAATFSAWKTTTAAPRGVAAGAAQSGGFFADVLGAFGQASAASYTGDMLGNMTPQQRRETDAAGEKLRTQGLDFSSEAGDLFRGVARDYSPDAATAHTSERLLFDASRVITKAVGYSVATGNPFAGAALTAGDEGMAVADDLKQQGVDLGTRTKVGAIVGTVTGIGVALPMAGNTLAQTAGLVAVGGPGAFIAQQAAVREVLNGAGYENLAEQYDPFDPVGLTLSTLIPVGFGAWGLRAAKARQAQAAVVAEQQAAREFAQGPVSSAETPTATAARAAFTPEQVDAARVLLSVEQRAKSNPFRPDDWRAYDAHEQAMTRAADQLAAGERVAVHDLLPPIPDNPAARAVLDELDALRAEREALLPESGALAERGAVREVRRELRAMEQERPNTSDEAVRALAKGIQAREGVSYKAALATAKKQTADAVADFEARQTRLNDAIRANAKAQQATQRVVDIDRRVTELEGQLGNDASLQQFARQVAAAARTIEAELPRPSQPRQGGTPNAPRAPDRTEAAPAPAQPQAADAPSAGRAAGAPATTADSGSGAAAPKAGLVDDAPAMRAEALAAERPDLMVQLDGMDAPVRLADLMASVKAEADDMVMDGQLFQVAATCALQVGS